VGFSSESTRISTSRTSCASCGRSFSAQLFDVCGRSDGWKKSAWQFQKKADVVTAHPRTDFFLGLKLFDLRATAALRVMISIRSPAGGEFFLADFDEL